MWKNTRSRCISEKIPSAGFWITSTSATRKSPPGLSRILAARADYYRAYDNYVAVLVREFGAYKVVNGEFIFPFQPTVNRYNAAARAMSEGAKRITDLQEERKIQLQSQQERWLQLVNGK